KTGVAPIRVQIAGSAIGKAAPGVIAWALMLNAGRPNTWLLRAGESASVCVRWHTSDIQERQDSTHSNCRP
ncbi:hypothetical protein LY78DRAFT_586398, partial [Colletotrichum sublineola]